MAVAPDAAEQLTSAIAPAVTEAGLHYEEVIVRTRGGRTQVTIVVDLAGDEPGSVDLDAVAEVSREISARLDEDDSFLGGGAYDLEVTTPGAERTLREPRHFRRSRGRLLEVRTHAERQVIARLLEVAEDGTLMLREQDPPGARPRARRRPVDPIELPLAEVASARVLVELSPPAADPASGTAPHADGADDADQEG